MSMEREKAHWNEEEVNALIDFFHKNQSEVGDGGNFRAEIYDAAAVDIASHLSEGPKKTGKMCKTKWVAIKNLYNAINNYRNQSGFHWDDDNGAGIKGDAAEHVWMEYTERKSNTVLRPYRNCGWKHYKKMEEIVPSGLARGTRAFYPSLANNKSLVDDENDQGDDESVTMWKESSTSSNVAGTGDGAYGDICMPPPTSELSGPSHSSLNLGKRKFSALVQDGTSSPGITSNKSGSRVASFSGQRSRSGLSNSIASTPVSSSTKISSKLTSAVALSGMQGSINRLTDVFEKSIAAPEPVSDAQAIVVGQAVDRVEQLDDGLSVDEKVELIKGFEKRPLMAYTYVRLNDSSVRQNWIRKTMEEFGSL